MRIRRRLFLGQHAVLKEVHAWQALDADAAAAAPSSQKKSCACTNHGRAAALEAAPSQMHACTKFPASIILPTSAEFVQRNNLIVMPLLPSDSCRRQSTCWGCQAGQSSTSSSAPTPCLGTRAVVLHQTSQHLCNTHCCDSFQVAAT